MSDPLEELLALSQANQEDPRNATRKAFEDALDRAKATMKCMPDDKEELGEEKELWYEELNESLKRLWTAMSDARKAGVVVVIDKDDLALMKTSKDTAARWKNEASSKTVKLAPVQDRPASAGPVPRTAVASDPAQTSGQNKAVASKEQTDDESDVPRDADEDPNVVTHQQPCKRCAEAKVECRGLAGRVCNRCKRMQQSCTKSSGRGGARVKRRREADEDAEQPPKVQKTMAPRRKRASPAPPPHGTDDEDDIEVLDSPPPKQKGKQKAVPPKPPKVTPPKPTIVITRRPTMQNASQPEKASKEIVKVLGKLEASVLLASAEVKRTQAEAKRAEGMLDEVLSELRSLRGTYDI